MTCPAWTKQYNQTMQTHMQSWKQALAEFRADGHDRPKSVRDACRAKFFAAMLSGKKFCFGPVTLARQLLDESPLKPRERRVGLGGGTIRLSAAAFRAVRSLPPSQRDEVVFAGLRALGKDCGKLKK